MRVFFCMTIAALVVACMNTSPQHVPQCTANNVGDERSEEEVRAPCSDAPILYQEYDAAREIRDLTEPVVAFSIPIFGACDDLEVIAFTASLVHMESPTAEAMPLCNLFDCSEGRGWSLRTGVGEPLRCHGPGVVGDGSTIVCTSYRADVLDEYALPVTASSWTRIEFFGLVRSDAAPGRYRFTISQMDVGRRGTADGGAFVLGSHTLTPQIIVE